MLRVGKEDLRLGMFIQSLEGSWFEHPFWKSRFLLSEMDDLRALQSSGIDAIWVDKDKSVAAAIAHLVAPEPAARPDLGPAPAAPVAPVAPAPVPAPV